MNNGKLRPIIFWEGFPPCGLLLKKVVKEYGNDLVIVATKAAVPFEGLEDILEHNIVWFSDPDEIWDRREEFGDRDFVIHTGWVHKGWLKYDKYVKEKNDARIVVSVDNSFRGDFRQKLGAIYFRLFLRNIFDGVFVPGKSGIRLMKYFGMPENRIYTGLYGAYEEIYKNQTSILERKKEFLYVGQLETRKGVDVLVNAFKKYRQSGGDWDLRIAGTGSLENLCNGDGIIYDGFVQPNNIAGLMNQSRVFILPSRHDNWGTVVCEAAACGMILITTSHVGASLDIVSDTKNGITIPVVGPLIMSDAMQNISGLSDDEFKKGSDISLEIARNFDSGAYYAAFKKMIDDLC